MCGGTQSKEPGFDIHKVFRTHPVKDNLADIRFCDQDLTCHVVSRTKKYSHWCERLNNSRDNEKRRTLICTFVSGTSFFGP